MRQTFRPAERIRRRADFQHVYTHGRRLHGRYMTLFLLPTERATGRLGIAATRKFGDAVDRVRAKRLARELFRHNKPSRGLDLVVIPKQGFSSEPYDRLESEFRRLVARGGERQPGAGRG